MTVLLLGIWPGVLFGILIGMQHLEDGLFTEPSPPRARRVRSRLRARVLPDSDKPDGELVATAP